MRKRNFCFFYKEVFYLYREDLTEEGSVIIKIETVEKFKKAICTIIKAPTIGATSGIETFSMGISAKMFKWQIMDQVRDSETNNAVEVMEGNLEDIKDFIKSKFENSNDAIEEIDYNADEMELKEKKRFSFFGKK